VSTLTVPWHHIERKTRLSLYCQICGFPVGYWTSEVSLPEKKSLKLLSKLELFISTASSELTWHDCESPMAPSKYYIHFLRRLLHPTSDLLLHCKVPQWFHSSSPPLLPNRMCTLVEVCPVNKSDMPLYVGNIYLQQHQNVMQAMVKTAISNEFVRSIWWCKAQRCSIVTGLHLDKQDD